MSDRSSGTTPRDYVESFVKDKDLENYLSKNQPQYDPNKATTTIEEQTPSEKTTHDNTTTSSKPSTFNFHERSKNPFANEEQQKSPMGQEIPQKQNVMYVVRDFLDQKKEIHEIAVDNCADLHSELLTCFKDGSWWDKAKMCEHQKQRFWNCYNKQKSFLKDANYRGPDNTPEQDSKIYRDSILLSKENNKEENTSASSKE
ncbi:hypothetical protein BDA99DRAFT_500848 [Phascolomyces articulosus]|uniref:COX assembly mitochondrial protein n=1 Tax=Phascolomyces articulosus TaxID=60185 RepID=A0AAD5K6L2_9FUNG|nr:hypothetical protein BDA99DRAFT_500848 [Phascolomyces articulosus]